jgi:hypothetical protein
MDNQGYSKLLFEWLLLPMKNIDIYFIVFMDSSSMDHIVGDYLPPNPTFMPE